MKLLENTAHQNASLLTEITIVQKPTVLIEEKVIDFSIGCHITSTIQSRGSDEIVKNQWDIPVVAIECKTYLDKTMLQDISTAAEQLKQKNPDAIYIVVAEWLKLGEGVNLKKYKIDQIYVVRKQKNTDREFRYSKDYAKNPIYEDVIIHLFNLVRDHLTSDWESSVEDGLTRGYLI